MSKYVYQRRGGPLLSWKSGVAPAQSRAAEATALGCSDCTSGAKAMGCGCSSKDAARVPRQGAPEYLGNYIATGDAPSTIAKIDDAVHTGAGRTVAMAANLYHGYRRNGSVGWALLWGALGYAMPVVTTVIATAQGFGHKKGS